MSIWELMIGGLLGYLSLGKRPGFRFQNALGLSGLALIASAVYFIDSNRSFPGWWALLPTIGAACILSAESSAFNHFVLASASFVAISRISYPLYLWHWPLLAFAKVCYGELSVAVTISVLALSLGLAVLTYLLVLFVEIPIRRHFSPRLALGLTGTLAAVFTASLLCFLRAHCRARTTPASSSCWRQVTTGPIPSAQSAFRTRRSGAFSPTATMSRAAL